MVIVKSKLINIIFLNLFVVFYSSCLGQNIHINSIPKCGTHLLGKCLNILTSKKHKTPGISWNNVSMMGNNIVILNRQSMFSHTHSPYTNDFVHIIKKSNIVCFFIYRDPRDHVVSWVYYANMRPIDSAITAMILSNSQVSGWPYVPAKPNINTIFRSYVPWIEEMNVCTVKYENLIGPRGGGNRDAQLKEIEKIAHYLGITLDNFQKKSIALQLDDFILEEEPCYKMTAGFVADNLFGNTSTFRTGKIGSWKSHFKEHHKKLFKDIAGQLLVDLGYEKDLNW